ncbi:hypothetical protein CEP53_001728 [Fusarium sp. AF-6]|nr:hypothetical protein CEP53_001728 [Fusarium sp. AF-6]
MARGLSVFASPFMSRAQPGTPPLDDGDLKVSVFTPQFLQCLGPLVFLFERDINSTEEPLGELTEEPVDEIPEHPMDEPMEEPEDDDLELPLGEPHPILDDTDTGSDVSRPTSDGDLPSPDRPLTPDL